MQVTRKLVACDPDHNRIYGAGLRSAQINRGVTAMTGSSWNRKVLIVIAVALSSLAVVVCIGLAYPIPVANPALGANWECHRSAGIVTTCRRISRVQPAIHRALDRPSEPQRV